MFNAQRSIANFPPHKINLLPPARHISPDMGIRDSVGDFEDGKKQEQEKGTHRVQAQAQTRRAHSPLR